MMVPGAAKQLIETFLSAIPSFLFSVRRTDLSLIWIAGAASVMTGFDPRDLAARPGLFADRFSTKDRERLSRMCASDAPGHTTPEDFRFRCADGRERWFRMIVVPSAGTPGDPLSVAGMAWSVEESRNLRGESHTARQAFLAADVPMFLSDLSGRIRLWNAAAERFFGWSPAVMEGGPVNAVFSMPEEAVDGLLRKVREEGEVAREDRLSVKGGERIPCRLSISVLKTEEGAAEGIVFTVGGIAELRGLESRLQEAITRLRIIEKVNRIIASERDFGKVQSRIVVELEKLVTFDRTSVALLGDEKDFAVIQVHAKGRTELGSGTRIKLEGSAPGWVLARRIARIDDDISSTADEFSENGILIKEGMRSRLVIPLFAGERMVGTLNFNSRMKGAYSLATIEELGSIPDQLALAIDKHRAYIRLKRSEERYRLLFEQGPPAAIAGPDGRFVAVNEGGLRLTGYSRQEFLRLRNADLYNDPESATRTADVLSSGRGLEKEALIRRKDGSTFFGHVNIFPVSRDLVLGQIFDVTERMELEARLRQAQKMEAVGTLAGGIAHDFNNIIQTVMGYTSLLRNRIEGQREAEAHVDAIEQASLRAAELTRQLLGFARKGKLEVKPTDIGGVVDKVAAMIRPTFDRSIEIRTRVSPGLHGVSGDSGQLEHTLLNLCINARDAMPGGGTLAIEARNEALARPEEFGSAKAPPGSYVSLRVSDTGTGISAGNLPRIFEPFFTTKEPGKGSGMGLAMVYGIVKNHGGWIDVRSEPGKGTAFRILLPASAEKPKAPAAPIRDSPEGGTGTILFVDDEEPLRELAVESLGGLGYKVITARNGEEAVSLYGEMGGEIALVIMDLIMPVMGGVEAFRRIREFDPGARILFSSGYAAAGRPEELPAEGAAGFIRKPYRIAALAAAIRQAMGGGG